MRHYLPQDVLVQLNRCIEQEATLDRSIADALANAIKTWAMDKGATHYTHWFQPLTGLAAQKHESFLELDRGQPIEKFSGGELVQREPEAPSFLHDGLRTTFEARGFTAWDPGSPAFILETDYGRTLCIPTVFVSYNGQSLDYKVPLLKSISLLERTALDICHLFDKHIRKVFPTFGAEQEYFLIDKALYDLRPDLVLCGRTLLGAPAARGQQAHDRYFSSIPDRAYAFMEELEHEAHKLGIPLKTRHNEVAPGQFECTPGFQELNIAVDHGQVLMELIDRIATKHGLKALLHEKPFSGINGSGKHNNWSLMTNTGRNLLSPGSNPKDNLMFLAFFTAIIHAFYTHARLMRAAIASAGNDHRIGGYAAPPAIMSVFIGKQLSEILDDVENPPRKKKNAPVTPYLRLGIKKIPELLVHNSDSNRTAPFAFTGDKFEFRSVGASANNAGPMTVLNLIVADQLKEFRKRVDRKMARSRRKEAAILDVIKDNISESKDIRYEGDSSSQSWVSLAKKRGLPNIPSTPEALDAYLSEASRKVFEDHGIFSAEELKARHSVLIDNYLHRIRGEAEVFEEMIRTSVIPCALTYQREMLEGLQLAQNLGLEEGSLQAQRTLAQTLASHIQAVSDGLGAIKAARAKADKHKQPRHIAQAYADQVLPLFANVRTHVDELELICPDHAWTLPKYRELLFIN